MDEIDQNAISLSSLDLTSPQKSPLSKGPSFVSTPKIVYRYELCKDFTQFVNQLRFKLRQSELNQDHRNQQELSEPIQSHPGETVLPPPSPRQDKSYGPLYNSVCSQTNGALNYFLMI